MREPRVKPFKQNIVVESVKSSRQVKQKEYNTYIVTIINFQRNVIVNPSKGGDGSLGDVQPQLSR